MATLQPFPSSGRTCRRCFSLLVEILSDNAGRLFGCRRCRGVDMHDAAPPADVIEQGTRTRRERRRMARGGRRLRLGARRVPRSWERTVPRPERWVVMPLAVFETMRVQARDLGDGWGFGLVCLPRRDHFQYREWGPIPRVFDPSARAETFVTTRTISFVDVGGGSFGLADHTAPEALVHATFARFTYERTRPAILGFMKECR